MLKNKIFISWSTGKDSAYALHQIRQMDDYEIVGLFSTITEEYDRVAMHSTRHELLAMQAEKLDLPYHPVLIPAACSNEIYLDRMQIFLEQLEKQRVTHVAFGDLFLEDVKAYRESLLKNFKITPVFPLWKKDTYLLAKEMIHAGVKAILTCIDPKKLDASFVGRQFDKTLLNDFPDAVDPCGENGEFHTFVYDGPMFSCAIPVSAGPVVEKNGFIFIDIKS